MRALRARTLLATALWCGAVWPGVPAAGAASGVVLRYHFAAGARAPYQMALGFSGAIPGLTSKLALSEKAAFTQTVRTVYPDGSALLVDTFTTATLTMHGQSTTTPLTGARVTERITPRGQVLQSTIAGLQSLTGGVLSVNPLSGAPVLPASPVKVGSHWTEVQRISLGSFGALSGPLHYKVLALHPAHGHTVATIQARGVLPLQGAQGETQATGTATAVNTIQFDVDGGALLSTHTTTKVRATFGGAPITVTLQLNVDRAP